MSNTLISEEIYPKIIVYKNTFKDINKTYSILKNSVEDSDDRLFEKWSQWSSFGKYLSPPVKNFYNITTDEALNLVAETKIKQEQKNFLIELLQNFELVTKDYSDRFNLNIYDQEKCIDKAGVSKDKWAIAGPSICRYDINTELVGGMRYHSDYVRERSDKPEYKFAVTALAYFNDDYAGGEIDFAIGKELFKYKPKAGDFLVFPSGHPEILTKEGNVYLHSVKPSYGTNKYFSRMYWQKWYDGTDEWLENEKKFGKEEWAKQQALLEEEYRKKHPQRDVIEGGIRIQ
jgi:hypothetical protein